MQLFFLLALMLLSASCSVRYVTVDDKDLYATYVERINSYNQANVQIKATLDIKAYGVLASFIHERADVIAQTPNCLYWSLRSFFGPPTLVLASNGAFLTLYDFTGANQDTYQKIAIEPDSFFDIFDLPFNPKILTEILLARISLGKNVVIKTADEKLLITSEHESGFLITSIFDYVAHRLLETSMVHKNRPISYRVKYQYTRSDGITFPSSLVLHAQSRVRFLKLLIKFDQIELNGDLVGKDIFYLNPY